MSDDDPHLMLGAYVLGGLDSDDRAAFEAHLEHCRRCRDELAGAAGLPALLRLTAPVADGVRPAPVAHLLQRRRRRRGIRLAAAGVAALAAVAVVAVVVTRPPAAPDLRLEADGGSSVQGAATFERKAWGTAIDLDLQQLPAGGRFVLQVEARDGHREAAATWGGTANRAVSVVAATSVEERDIVRLAVVEVDGARRTIATSGAAAMSG